MAYSLVVGEEVSPDQENEFNKSRVVHVTIDPSIPTTRVTTIQEEADAAAAGQPVETDPDRVITNSRPCEPSDGLLDYDGLVSLYQCV